MEEQITEKCCRVFESCVLISHVKVSKKFLELALKRITPGSEYFKRIADSWGRLQDRIDII